MPSSIGNMARPLVIARSFGPSPGIASVRPMRLQVVAMAMSSLVAASALANPTGPQVLGGSATIATAGSVMTVTSPGGAMIDWKGFSVAPGETLRFVQPDGSTVVNRVTNGSLGIEGRVEASGRVLFLQGGSVSGAGVGGDLGVMTAAALRTSSLAPPTGVQARDLASRAAQALKHGQAFVIGPRGTALTTDRNSNVLLAAGRGAELGDRRLPFVRVVVVAATDKPLDLDALVAARPNGIFNALFLSAGPASSHMLQGESGTLVATIGSTVEAPAPDARQTTVPEPVAIELRVASLAALPEERALMAELAPVEERAGAPVIRVPAPVEDRVIVVWAAPVEDRAATAVVRAAAPVEERLLIAIVREPATVEERVALQVAKSAAPVEPRMHLALARDGSTGASREATAPAFTRTGLAAAPLASFRPDIVQAQQLLMKEAALASGDDSPARVAQAAVEKVAVPAAAAVVAPSEQPIRLAGIQRRMPRIMIDYRGAVFHM